MGLDITNSMNEASLRGFSLIRGLIRSYCLCFWIYCDDGTWCGTWMRREQWHCFFLNVWYDIHKENKCVWLTECGESPRCISATVKLRLRPGDKSGDEPNQGRHFLRRHAGPKWKICKGGRITDVLERRSLITGNGLSTVHFIYVDRMTLDHGTASNGQSFFDQYKVSDCLRRNRL